MMKRNWKRFVLGALATGFAAILSFPSAAGTWNLDGTSWRYEDDNGRSVEAGWIKDRNAWYFFAKDGSGEGAMQIGWVNEGGNWYYLDPATGAMVTNQVVDGYFLDADGVWRDENKSSRRSGDYDEDYTEDDEEWLDEDQSDWDDSDSDSGPGQGMKSTKSSKSSGPGSSKSTKTSERVYVPDGVLAERESYTPSSKNPSTYNNSIRRKTGTSDDEDEEDEEEDEDTEYDESDDSSDDEDEEDEDYDESDESGGSKADWLAVNKEYSKENEKPESQYDTNGSNFDYEQKSYKDDNGETRIVIEKTRVRGDGGSEKDNDDDE